MTTIRIFLLIIVSLIPFSGFSQYSESQTDSPAKIVFENKRFYDVEDFSGTSKPDNTGVKNIICMIGDGMGVAQVYGALVANKGNLYMKNMPVTGFSITYSAANLITDSAAGGTALSTGKKTKNGVIGMDSSLQAQKTILQLADKEGLSTGIVATSSITHATPASFIAHQPGREMHDEIALDFLDTDIDVFIGGGRNYFNKKDSDQNLLNKLEKKGYDIIQDQDLLSYYSGDKLAGLLYPMDAPPYIDGRGDMLPISTKTALKVLSKNQKGFFLMVEGSQIDWGCHNNNTTYTISETLDFDRALGEALKFAAEDGQTLVVVTADHETGGFSVAGGSMEKGIVEGKFSTESHTATMVPVFAFGPGSELFTGIHDNTEFFFIFKDLLGLEIYNQDKPVISNITVNPEVIDIASNKNLAISAKVTTNSSAIQYVTADLSSLGDGANVPMTPDGNVYSYTCQVAAGIPAGNKSISITAVNSANESHTEMTSVEIIDPAPIFSAEPSSITLEATKGSQKNITITSNVSWTVSTTASWISLSATSGSENGTITVTASDNESSDNRSASVTIQSPGFSDITVYVTQEWVEIMSVDSVENDQIKLYPNPAGSKLYIEKLQPAEITILNIQGSVVKRIKDISTTDIDVSFLPKGPYIVRIYTKENVFFKKIVKK